MQLRRRVALNDRQLDEVDERILIQSIEPQEGKEQTAAVTLWGADGSRVTNRKREYLDVKVSFSLDIRGDSWTERGEILDAINTWAAEGGILTVSTKPGRKLRVIAWQLPADGDAMAWTNRFTITFRAYGIPYWQCMPGNMLRQQDVKSVDKQMGVPGNIRSTVDAEFVNTSGAQIDTFEIRTGLSRIKLTGLGLKNRETLLILHADDGRHCVLQIQIASSVGVLRSAMSKRTTDSDDDLYAEAGATRIVMSAGGNGTLTVIAEGRYA